MSKNPDYITDAMVERARMAIEDEAIRRRDAHIFVICGNGIAVRERDGSDSAIHRMRSDEAFLIGLAAISDELIERIAAKVSQP